MGGWPVSDEAIIAVEQLLLREGCHFANDAKDVIRCWDSTDVSACPGSGKTTVLLAKLKIIADHMPLENGAAICVLSHTNVAVDEIKSKLTAYSEKLMSYPNYIGTIQTFIDRYVTFPYLRSLTKEALQVVDDKTYSQHLWATLSTDRQYWTLSTFIRQRFQQSNGIAADVVDYVKDLYLLNGELFHKSQKKRLAGSTSASAKQFGLLRRQLLINDGLITYDDAYEYAFEAIDRRPDLADLLSRRFRFVFVDEYQDCNENQRSILDRLFDRSYCSVVRIGDPDQAIYNSDKEQTADWVPESEALTIASSSRYSQNIADKLTPLRNGRMQITSLCGNTGAAPTIIVFDDNSMDRVIGAFISLLEKHQINDPNGIYKAVGWIKSKTSVGLKISDYWDKYQADSGNRPENRYWSVIDAICDELNDGKLYRVENLLRKLLVRILRYHGCKDANGNALTFNTVKKRLDEKYFDIYRSLVFDLADLRNTDRNAIDQIVRNAINTMLGTEGRPADAFSGLPPYFMEEPIQEYIRAEDSNIFIEPLRGRKIHVSTVHKVKGETHDATLYLETEYKRKSDLQRVIPYYKGTKPGTGQLDHYCRKLVYVGFSRPRKLLCVAMRASTYEKDWKKFEGWEVYDCRGDS